MLPHICYAQDIPEIGIKDYEFVETYKVERYDGPVSYNSEEISQISWTSLPDLLMRMRDCPSDFSPWFLQEARLLGWLAD
jgi:isopentenyldiphosphate isomerase